MTEQEKRALELEKLKNNSPFALPDNPAESGWPAAQIKEKFWKGFIVLLEIINEDRDSLAEKMGEIDSALEDLNGLEKVMARARADEDGTNIKTSYAKIQSLTNGTIAILKYIKESGQTGNIYDIEKAVSTVTQTLDNFIANKFSGEKAKKAIDADFADRATKDIDGNPIKTTYAKQSGLEAVSALITALTNGSSIADKARKDQDGNRIDLTYLKLANIISGLNDTSTNKAASAYAVKQLNDKITALETLLNSDDTSLDTLQEVVTYIKNNSSLIESITLSKVSVSDIIDNLTSQIADKPVSAKQAYILKGLIDDLTTSLGTLGSRVTALESAHTQHQDIANSLSIVDGAINITYTE